MALQAGLGYRGLLLILLELEALWCPLHSLIRTLSFASEALAWMIARPLECSPRGHPPPLAVEVKVRPCQPLELWPCWLPRLDSEEIHQVARRFGHRNVCMTRMKHQVCR